MEGMEPQESHETSLATVRRVPRYGVFMALGAVVGVIAALVLTFTGSFEPTPGGEVTYSAGQVFGFTLLYLVPIGIALGAVVAMLIERVVRRRDRVVRVDHERIISVDEHPDAAASDPDSQA